MCNFERHKKIYNIYFYNILYEIRFSPLTEPPRSARRRSTVTVKEDWVTLMMMRIMIMMIKWEGSKKAVMEFNHSFNR